MLSRSDRMLRAGRLLTGSWAEAEDLLQEVMSRTFRHLSALPTDSSRDAYLLKSMTRLHVRRMRRFWKREVPSAPVDTPAREETSDDDLDVRAALLVLPARQRLVLVYRYFLDMSVADTAVAMNCHKGTVKSQTSIALAALRRALVEADELNNGGVDVLGR